MRIIAGQYKGRSLRAPKGATTRPTTDRVRESLFSSINSYLGGWQDCVVLDLFAGSGALGLEALSRGARSACFCERDRNALSALQANLAIAPKSQVRLLRTDVRKRLPSSEGQPFNLLFLDPPYALGAEEVAALIAALRDAGSLAPGALISYEHDAKSDPRTLPAFASLELQPVGRKKFGSTVIDLLVIEEQ